MMNREKVVKTKGTWRRRATAVAVLYNSDSDLSEIQLITLVSHHIFISKETMGSATEKAPKWLCGASVGHLGLLHSLKLSGGVYRHGRL